MSMTAAERMRRYRARHREEIRERENKRLRARYANGWREHPQKKHARNELHHALRRGLISRQPCAVCGKKAEAHHNDYARPLDVTWLCRDHHEQQHHPLESRAS